MPSIICYRLGVQDWGHVEWDRFSVWIGIARPSWVSVKLYLWKAQRVKIRKVESIIKIK